jgi:hypothetical protein
MGVETRDEDYNGTTITFLDLSAAIDATGSVGSDVPEIGWAVAGDVVVIGVGDAFIRSVIDTTPDTSLASTDRYEQLVGRVGREHFTSFWLDVVGLRDLVETMGAEAPDGMADYEANVKPYLEPFDAIVGAAVAGAELDRTTIILSVK